MAAAMDIQGIAGAFDTKFGKKNIGHIPVEVLAGVNQNLLEVFVLAQLARERERFDELGSRADDGYYPLRTPVP
jgi:hypothetical protein